MKKTIFSPPLEKAAAISEYGRQRRNMLKFFGASAAVITIGSSCKDDDDQPMTPNGGINLGSGDVGILNYAYALEQLEAAFYEKVVSSFYSGATDLEKEYLTDIRNHEVGHREFFKLAIPAASIITPLTPDFSTINFTDRTSVLGTAKAFEDLGVTAYNGAGKLISTTDTGVVYLGLAGKIVSVEARHAALIADLISPGTFAATANADANGLDVANTPATVLAIANTFLTTKVDGSNLPTS